MEKRKSGIGALVLSYILWGFQPLYWKLLSDYDSLLLLALRIVFSAVFSCVLLLCTGELGKLKGVFTSRAIMKKVIPATVFVFLDWAVFIVAIGNGRVLDCSLGYYINPIILFAGGVIIYKEKATKTSVIALAIAFAGIAVSVIAFGEFPLLTVVIAINWAVYALIKKTIDLDGVLSIAVETLLMSPAAIAYIIITGNTGVLHTGDFTWILLVLSGVVTAMPMFLYSNCVRRQPMIVMAFAQYLSPSFNLICGLVTGERFTPAGLTSLAFFLTSVIVFSAGTFAAGKNTEIDEKQPDIEKK